MLASTSQDNGGCTLRHALHSSIQDSLSSTGLAELPHSINQPVALPSSPAVMADGARLLQKVTSIAETLDALEAELKGDASASRRLGQLLDDFNADIPTAEGKSSDIAVTTTSLQAVREGLEELLSLFQHNQAAGVTKTTAARGSATTETPSASSVAGSKQTTSNTSDQSTSAEAKLPAPLNGQVLDNILNAAGDIAANATGRHWAAKTPEPPPLRRDPNAKSVIPDVYMLDEVLSQVVPIEERLNSAESEHSRLTESMTQQLCRLVEFTQKLNSQAELLEARHQKLNADQVRLDEAREALSFERERVSHERFELSLRREALDAETEELRNLYLELSADIEARSAVQTPVEAAAIESERRKLQRLVEFIDVEQEARADDLAHEQSEELVGATVGGLMLAQNSTQNSMRSRDEAVRQLDELIQSYASGDDAAASVAISGTSEAEAGTESTLNLDSGSTWWNEGDHPELAAEGDAGEDPSTDEEDDADLTQDEVVPPRMTAEYLLPESFPEAPSDQNETHDELSDPVKSPLFNSLSQASDLLSQMDEEAEPTESRLFASSSTLIANTAAAAPQDAPATASAADEGSEDAKLNALRTRLAEMFGINEGLSSAPAATAAPVQKPLDERFQSFFNGGSSVVDPVSDDANSTATSSMTDGSLLREVLKAETSAETSAPNVVAPVAEVTAPVAKAEPKPVEAAASGEVDPIKAYMEQLLARNRRGDEPASPNPAPAASSPAKSVLDSQVGDLSQSIDFAAQKTTRKLSEDDLSWLAEGPKHKQDKDAVRNSMKVMRELANDSARKAVVRAGRKQLRLQVLTKTAATLM